MGILQPVPAWGPSGGYTYHSHVVLSQEGSDCGFLIPRLWMSAVVHQTFQPYWAACVVGNLILISGHVLDHAVEDGRGQAVIEDTIRYVNNIRSKCSD